MRKQKLIYGSLAFAAAAAAVYATGRKSRSSNAASPTNASSLPPKASPDDILDAAVEYTFPASDPIAITSAYRNALRREAQS